MNVMDELWTLNHLGFVNQSDIDSIFCFITFFYACFFFVCLNFSVFLSLYELVLFLHCKCRTNSSKINYIYVPICSFIVLSICFSLVTSSKAVNTLKPFNLSNLVWLSRFSLYGHITNIWASNLWFWIKEKLRWRLRRQFLGPEGPKISQFFLIQNHKFDAHIFVICP